MKHGDVVTQFFGVSVGEAKGSFNCLTGTGSVPEQLTGLYASVEEANSVRS